jgi:hypothetical protein
MQRWQGCLIVLVAGPLMAQEWRPVSQIKAEPAASQPAIQLGKPRLNRSETTLQGGQPLPREAVQYQSARYNDLANLPAPVLSNEQPVQSFLQTRYQGPGSAAEEAFNCGQVPGSGGAAPGGAPAPYYGQPAPPAGGAPAPYYGQPGAPPPPGGPAPASSTTPWYQPIKNCWNRIFGGGSGNNGIPGTWDARSDQGFKDFISPVTNPTYFEDPRSLTEFRFIGIYQRAPGDNPLLDGGTIYNFNLQGRISINDNWSLILHRLGFSNIKTGDNAVGYGGGTGIDDIQLGVKYTFLRDTRSETLLAAGVSFEIPIGSSSVLAGTGAGVTPYLSYGQGFLDNWHFLATGGYRFGFAGGSSDFLFASAHLDYGFFKRFYPLVEMNWYYYTGNGDRQSGDFEGGDLRNIGADNVSGKSLITLAGGFRFKFSDSLQAGIVYEMPVVGTDMLEKYRVMLDFIIRY